MTSLNNYLIEPLAPLVFRSGKPFGAQSGADSALFPVPSSLAGLLRTVLADQQFSSQEIDQELSDTLRQTVVRGPLLARYDANQTTLLVPKPADAMYLNSDGRTTVMRLAPKALDLDCGSDLPHGLLHVQMQESLQGKPQSGPQYWSLTDFLLWQRGENVDVDTLKSHGLDSLPNEKRTHAAIDPTTFANIDGKLFQTSGLDLGYQRNAGKSDGVNQEEHTTWQDCRLGFWAQTTANLQNDLVVFGGERRLSRIMTWPTDNDPTECNTQLSADIRAAKGIKLTLLSPAIFKNGYLPAWLDSLSLEGEIPHSDGLRVKLKACAIERWQAVSGFDLQMWKPKVMRKAVGAGAVYWFEVLGDVPDNLHQTLWIATISDDLQDQHDGFGIILPAAWQPPTP